MGNNKPVEKKRKKKGRPSLLDLQKRSLRLQRQQQQQQQQPKNRNPSPSPNPYLRFPNPTSGRRITRRSADPEADPEPDDDEDDDEDEDAGGNRREKKLKLVLRLPHRSANSPAGPSDSAPSGSESDADGKRKIGDGHRDKAERRDSSKATDAFQGEPSDSGPTTPLPDKKLLVFILDRLQKKDTYGVFSEPVDPKELPDYFDVIQHPMDFGTVRKKLASGAYENLEQFEKDVFLISSNAMRYNAPDTIYYRQARSIHELAKKNFENLRQESDDNEPEPKTVVRRGRPPSKSTIKRTVGRPPAERTASDFSSDATLANAGDNTHWSNLSHDLLRKGSALDKPGTAGVTTRASLGLRNNETFSWVGESKSEKNEEYSGSAMKGISTKYGKKLSIIDENRRNTYKQPQPSTCAREAPLLTTFDGEKKQLVPVGLNLEHAYARSLARFAANLGPVGWAIAAKKIERALPPGTKFGRGWVGDGEAPQQSQPPLLSTSPPHPSSLPKVSPCTTVSRGDKLPQRLEPPSNDSAVEEGHLSRALPPVAASAVSNRSSDSLEGAEPAKGSNYEAGLNLLSGVSGNSQSRPSFQFQRNPVMTPTANGFNTPFGFNLASQLEKMVRSTTPGSFGSEPPMTHGRVLDMVSRGNNSFIHQTPMGQFDVEKAKMVGNSSTISFGGSSRDPGHDSQGTWQGLSLQPKPDSVPPDLNVRFQSPGSPASSVMVDSQPPDLALQL